MMEKSALAGEGVGCTPTPFQPISKTYKVAEYSSAERADTFPLFHLYPIMYSSFGIVETRDTVETSGEPRTIFGSNLGYPFTDLSIGLPPLKASTLYASFSPESIGNTTKYLHR
jgi:hypothetical protein